MSFIIRTFRLLLVSQLLFLLTAGSLFAQGSALEVDSFVPVNPEFECSAFFSYDSVVIEFGTVTPQVQPGERLSFEGTLRNDNTFPLLDTTLYARVFRVDDTTASAGDGNPVVDQFVVEEGFALAPGETKGLVHEWLVPRNAIAGEYYIGYYLTAQDGDTLSGLTYTDHQPASVADFSVLGETTEVAELSKLDTTINGEDYVFTDPAPVFDQSDNVIIRTTITNPTNETKTIPLQWTQYSWDGIEPTHQRHSNTELIMLEPGETREVDYVVLRQPEPTIYVTAVTQDLQAKSYLNLRLVQQNADGMRLQLPGLSAFPLRAGEETTLFTCAETTNVPVVDDVELSLTLVDGAGNTIHDYTYTGPLTGAQSGFADSFVPEQTYSNLTLIAMLRYQGDVIDSTTLTYDCNNLFFDSCTAAADTTENEKEGMAVSQSQLIMMVVGAVVLLLILLVMFVLLRKKIASKMLLLICFALVGGINFFLTSVPVAAAQGTCNYQEQFYGGMGGCFGGYDDDSRSVTVGSEAECSDLCTPFWECRVRTNVSGDITGGYINFDCAYTPFFSCTGSIPSNAARYDSEEESGLSSNTPWVHSSSDTSAKCQYRCDSGYTWNGSSCAVSNTPPNAYAGINRVITQPASSVSAFGATATDAEGSVTRSWSQMAGPAVASISGGTTLTPTFSNLTNTGTYTFRLIVTDSGGLTDTDFMTVTVNNAPPSMPTITGPTTGLINTNYTFNFSSTDPGDMIRYQVDWNNNGIFEIGLDQNIPFFGYISPASRTTPRNWPSDGIYTFRVRAQDDQSAVSGWRSHTINISAPNLPPTANAGSNRSIVQPMNFVTISGASASDPDGTWSALWTKVSGPVGGTISNQTTLTPTIANLTNTGTYRFRLTVTDNDGAIATDDMEVVVSAAAPPPPPALSFNGSPLNIVAGNSATLSWTVTGPADSCWGGGPAGWADWKTSSGSHSESVSPVTDTTYTLECWNSGVSSGERTVTINVNTPPTANAGFNRSITQPVSSVSALSADADDTDGSWSALWTQVGTSPSVASIVNPTSLTPTFNNLTTVGTYTFRLTVTDNEGATAIDTMTVTVNPAPAGTYYIIATSPTTITEGDSVNFEYRCHYFAGIVPVTRAEIYGGNPDPLVLPGPGGSVGTFTQTFTSAGNYTVWGTCAGDLPFYEDDALSGSVNVTVTPSSCIANMDYAGRDIAFGGPGYLATGDPNPTVVEPSCCAGIGWYNDQPSCPSCYHPGTPLFCGPPPAPPPSLPPPTLSVNANGSNPETVDEGDAVTINWTINDADSCTASGDWSGSKSSTNGSHSESIGIPASGSYTYILSCSNSDGSTSQTVDVTVNALPNLTSPSITGQTPSAIDPVTGNYSTVGINIAVANIGGAPTGNDFWVRVEFDPDGFASEGGGPLPVAQDFRYLVPGLGVSPSNTNYSSETLNNVPFGGNAQVRITADDDDDVAESDETDNEAVLTVGAAIPTLNMDLTLDPTDLVRAGGTVDIGWNTNAMFPMDCTLSGPGLTTINFDPSATPVDTDGPVWAGPIGEVTTAPISNKSQYTLSCEELVSGTGVVFTESVSIETTGYIEEL